VLLELPYPPLPGATGTELGSASVWVVLSRTVVVLVNAALAGEADALALVAEGRGVTGESVAGVLEVEVELQAASPCATVKLLPESG